MLVYTLERELVYKFTQDTKITLEKKLKAQKKKKN